MEKIKNKTRLYKLQLKEGDKVWLYAKNLKTKRLSRKLNYIKVGLFRIKAIKGLVNYQLNLLTDVKIFPTFHILLLEKANNNKPIITTFGYELKEENTFKVKKILNKNN